MINIKTTFSVLAIAMGLAAGVQAQVRELQVAPAMVEIEAGARQTVVVTAFDGSGNAVPGVSFTWSGAENIATIRVDPSVPSFLVVEGIAEGRGVVAVRLSGEGVVTATLTVVVVGGSAGPTGSGTAAVLNIEPATIYLFPTEEAQLSAVFLRADGEYAGRERLTWQSLYEPAAQVTPSGKVIGISAGQGVILVEAPSGLSARAAVHVGNEDLAFANSRMGLSPLSADTIRVVVPSQGNRAVVNRQLRFASTNRQVVAVTPLGVVNAIQMGEAAVIVQGFGQQIRLPVSVHRPVQTMWALPLNRSLTVPVSGSRPVTVRFEAADGSAVDEARAAWSIGDPTIARYDDNTGLVTGLVPGTTTLRAIGPAPQLDYEWNVSVVEGEIALDVERIGLARGETHTVTAVFVDSDGSELGPVEGLGWQSGNAAVATVDENGTITAVGFGRTTIDAVASWGDTTSIEVFSQGVLLVASDRTGNPDVYVVDVDSVESIHRLTSEPGTELSASYSPDGSRIVYVSYQGTNSELVLANADGSEPVQLTTTLVDEGSPTFTPDGQRIVFASVSQGENGPISDLGVMNADGSGSAVLTDGTARRDQPSVSPDGSLVAYRSNEVGGRNIFVMGLDGSGARPVTQDETSATSPHWFPDGRLGYVSRRRTDGGTAQVVIRLDINTGAEEQLSPDSLNVSEFTVLGDGRLALVIEVRERDLILLRLFVENAEGVLVEVPRLTDFEQFLTPRAR